MISWAKVPDYLDTNMQNIMLKCFGKKVECAITRICWKESDSFYMGLFHAYLHTF